MNNFSKVQQKKKKKVHLCRNGKGIMVLFIGIHSLIHLFIIARL